MAQKIKLEISGYTVFIVECPDGSYYSDFCRDINFKLYEINNRLIPYFLKNPQLLPVKVVFREDHLIFKEAFIKHRYLRGTCRKHREKIVKTGKWPASKVLLGTI